MSVAAPLLTPESPPQPETGTGSGRAIGMLTSLNLIGACVALANSVVTARLFGTSRPMEVFFASAAVQVQLVSLVQTGQLAEIFLPVYHRIKHSAGTERARAAFSVLMNWMLLVTIVAAGAAVVLAHPLIRLMVPAFSAEDHLLGAKMFAVLAPLVVIQMLFGLLESLANAERRFGAPETISIVGRIIIFLSFVLLAKPTGIWSNVYSLWIGAALQFVAYRWLLRRLGYRHTWQLRSVDFSFQEMLGKLTGTWFYMICTQVAVFNLNAALSGLPQGAYAVFKYVEQIYAKTNSTVLRPVSVVFFTHCSEAVASGSAKVVELTHAALAKCLGISTLCIVAVIVSVDPLLRALWESRHFKPDDLDLAKTLMVVFYATSLSAGAGLIWRKLNVSLGMVRRQYIASGLAQLITALLAVTIIPRMGLLGGVIVALCAVVLLQFASLGPLLIWRRSMVAFYEPSRALRWALAAAAGIAVGRLVAQAIGSEEIQGRLNELLAALLLAGCGAGTTLLLARVLQVPEVLFLQRMFQGMRRRVTQQSEAVATSAPTKGI